MAREIIVTKDGSHTLFHPELNETYHSVHGAIQESKYVFIQNGLAFWLERNEHRNVNILEIGFGTGLNALLAAQLATAIQVRINFATVDAYPLSKDLWSRLNYTNVLGDAGLFKNIHETSWDVEHEISSSFVLNKHYSTLQDVKFLPDSFDVVFYDAFAPAKQPEMWNLDMLEKVTTSLKNGGVFSTYCAKGQLKRDLVSLGLVVETLAGPPGKKEMVRAIKGEL